MKIGACTELEAAPCIPSILTSLVTFEAPVNAANGKEADDNGFSAEGVNTLACILVGTGSSKGLTGVMFEVLTPLKELTGVNMFKLLMLAMLFTPAPIIFIPKLILRWTGDTTEPSDKGEGRLIEDTDDGVETAEEEEE